MPNILIVEDDININNLLCEVLTKSGYECEQAFSGTEAKLLLNMKENAYTLVLLDLMLPGASGEDVLKEIRKKREASDCADLFHRHIFVGCVNNVTDDSSNNHCSDVARECH